MAQPGGSNVPPWNKGRKVGQKRALRPPEVWLIRDRLRAERRVRDLALFNLALDSKLPARDLVCLQASDVWYPHRVRQRGRVVLQRTGKPLKQCGFLPRSGGHSSSYWCQQGQVPRLGQAAPRLSCIDLLVVGPGRGAAL